MLLNSELMKIKTEEGKTAWVCTICGYIYYGEELPDDFKCPMCGVPKELFKKKQVLLKSFSSILVTGQEK